MYSTHFTIADDATVRKGNRKPTSELFVGNLSPMTTETDLTKAFDGCINARIIRDTETGKWYVCACVYHIGH